MSRSLTSLTTSPGRSGLKPPSVHITWADGHESAYEGGLLRFICPCALCRGHAPGEVDPPAWEACKDVRVSHAAPVGQYALRFTMSDGHETGIFMYDLLREHG